MKKKQLEEYKTQSTTDTNIININPIKYKKTNGFTFGRVYPLKSLSLGSIRKEIRHTIAADIYTDIDITNAHPEIIYQTCKYNNIQCDILEHYVLNRTQHIKDIRNTYNVSYEQAKRLFIILLYFGDFTTWIKQYNLDITFKPTEFITKFIEQRNIYGKHIEDANDDIALEIKARKTKQHIFNYNDTASIVAIWCQEIEHRILQTIYTYATTNKYIYKKNTVLCFDGIMI